MLRIEAHAACEKPADVPQAFRRRGAAVMDDADTRHERVARHHAKPHAPVEVLEVEEEARIETAGAVDHVAPDDQERTGHDRHADRVARWIRIYNVAQLITCESPLE